MCHTSDADFDVVLRTIDGFHVLFVVEADGEVSVFDGVVLNSLWGAEGGRGDYKSHNLVLESFFCLFGKLPSVTFTMIKGSYGRINQ